MRLIRASLFARAVAGVSDTTPPTLLTASVEDATPTHVDLVFSEPLNATWSAASAWTVSGHTVSAITRTGANTGYLTVDAFVSGEAARSVSYSQPGSNNMQDLVGNLLASFSGGTAVVVTNNVAAVGGGGSAVVKSLVVSRITGYAPMAIHIDSTDATSPTYPAYRNDTNGGAARNIVHRHYFGIAAAGKTPGVHRNTGSTRDFDDWAGGTNVRTYYEPGVYTLRVDQSEDKGATYVTSTQVITVLDPTTLNAVVISKTGNFNTSLSNYPTVTGGATITTRTTLGSFANNTRYYFDAADDWSSTDLIVPPNGATNISFNSYGTNSLGITTQPLMGSPLGAGPKFLTLAVGTGRLNGSPSSDLRFSNLRVGSGFQTEWPFDVLFDNVTSTRDVAFSHCEIGANYYHTVTDAGVAQSTYQNQQRVFLTRCNLFGDAAMSGAITNTDNAYTLFGNVVRGGGEDTRFGRNSFCTPIRTPGTYRAAWRHCRADSTSVNSQQLTWKWTTGGMSTYADNWLASGGQHPVNTTYVNWRSDRSWMADCVLGGSDATSFTQSNWLLEIGPQNDTSSEAMEGCGVVRQKSIHATGWDNSLNRDIILCGANLIARGPHSISGPGTFQTGTVNNTTQPTYNGPEWFDAS